MTKIFVATAAALLAAMSAGAQTHSSHTRTDSETATGRLVNGVPSDATARCNDGMFSKAPTKGGACMNHGGLKTWYADDNMGSPSGPAPARHSNDPEEATGETVSGVPSDATGKCKDGMFSKAGKKANACQSHGGVAIWYAGS